MKTLHGITAAVLLATCVPVLAQPPAHAPAHGWRKKHDPYYHGYTGKKWQKDYGVLEGRCNSAAVGAVLGGAAGGVIGSQVAKGDDRPVAIVVGTVVGAVIGAKIGADIDAADRGCMGHALELAGDQRTVAWTNQATGVTYRLTPTRAFERGGQPCREFTTVVAKGKNKKKESITAVACRRGNGEWEFRA